MQLRHPVAQIRLLGLYFLPPLNSPRTHVAVGPYIPVDMVTIGKGFVKADHSLIVGMTTRRTGIPQRVVSFSTPMMQLRIPPSAAGWPKFGWS